MSSSELAEGAAARQGIVARYWPELAAALLLIGATFLVSGENLTHDVVWQFWIARQLNAGVPLYTWIMEVNPPLWYWMAQPIDLLAAHLGWPPLDLLCDIIFLLICLSLTCLALFTASWDARQRAATYLAALCAMVIVAIPDFAQREHLLLIATIPYVMLIAARSQAQTVPFILALTVALLATPIFALKHYFALVPIALELWLIWHRRWSWRPLRTETVVLALGALAYGWAVLALTPEYLSSIVPALSLVYGDTRMHALAVLINQMVMMLVISAFYFAHFRRELSPSAQATLVAAVALVLCYFIQFKGWSYHAVPVIGALVFAFALHLAQRPSQPRLRWSEWLVIALALVIGLVPPAQQIPFRHGFEENASRLLATAEPGMSTFMLTTHPARIWPMVDMWGLEWPSRYYHLWMMQSVIDRQSAGLPIEGPLLDLVTQMRIETVEDLACRPPEVFIVDGMVIADGSFDILAFFEQEPRFAALMEAYQVQSTLGPFTIYERVGELPAPTGDCMTLAPARHIYPRPGAPA